MEQETFKPIPGFSSYRMNLKGQILNDRNHLISSHNSNGYLRSSKLKGDDGRRRSVDIHRLLVATFLGPIPPKMWVNHKDGNKQNNDLNNLEIITPTQNHIHARDVLKRNYITSENAPHGRLNKDAVMLIRMLGKKGWSQRRIAMAFDTSQPTISNILSNTTWKRA